MTNEELLQELVLVVARLIPLTEEGSCLLKERGLTREKWIARFEDTDVLETLKQMDPKSRRGMLTTLIELMEIHLKNAISSEIRGPEVEWRINHAKKMITYLTMMIEGATKQ
jgi:hypothetical protein